MTAYRAPDGLETTRRILASLSHEVRAERLRRRVQGINLVVFGLIFLGLLAGETFFASMMFALIRIEILGTVFSGAAFALLVPTVVGYAHIRLHHEGDLFLRWWLGRLAGIGVLVFALGMSLMIGFSAWHAAQDAAGAMATGPTGTLGGQIVGGDADPSSGFAGWIGVIPNSLLFLGLSFGMIITIAFASFSLGRALEAFNILTQTPQIGAEITARIEAATAKIALFRRLRDANVAARRKLPFDMKVKFARLASHACRTAAQAKLATARRVFAPFAPSDPLAAIVSDPSAATIPARFQSEDEFAAHMAEQIDIMRTHNVLRVLTGIPQNGKDRT